MSIFSLKGRVCAICHRALLSEDDGYRPQKYQDALFCGPCGKEFRRWEAMERAHKGKIKFRPFEILEPYFDHRKHFYNAKWTREKVLNDIREARERGALRQCYRQNRPLWDAARRRFGTWKKAVRASATRFDDNVSRKSTPAFHA